MKILRINHQMNGPDEATRQNSNSRSTQNPRFILFSRGNAAI